MNATQQILAIVGTLVVLLAVGGGAYAVFMSSAKEKTEQRLRDENIDLTRRLTWIEPRFTEAEAKNDLLMKIHNPTARLEAMARSEEQNHEETVNLLKEQASILKSIDNEIHRSKP